MLTWSIHLHFNLLESGGEIKNLVNDLSEVFWVEVGIGSLVAVQMQFIGNKGTGGLEKVKVDGLERVELMLRRIGLVVNHNRQIHRSPRHHLAIHHQWPLLMRIVCQRWKGGETWFPSTRQSHSTENLPKNHPAPLSLHFSRSKMALESNEETFVKLKPRTVDRRRIRMQVAKNGGKRATETDGLLNEARFDQFRKKFFAFWSLPFGKT